MANNRDILNSIDPVVLAARAALNPNVWADEAEGPDLYELLFRPRIDRKLHEANPAYWER